MVNRLLCGQRRMRLLFELDQQLANCNGVRYCRFMDDLLIISKTRWQLRRAITTMNQWFEMAALIT
jgi:hypothetical protein